MGSSAGLAPGFKERVDQLVAASGGKVSITSGFRTRAQQIQARKDNGCPDIYKSPSKDCRIPTAIPGTSQHEKGLAVDFGGDLNLAARLAPQFGLHRTVAGEPWHFESTTAVDGVAERGGAVVGKVASVGDDDGLVDQVIDGLKRVLITGLVLLGGVGMIAAGAYRATTGKSATQTTARRAKDAAGAAATAAAIA
jgi:hypothetical protein